MRSAIAIAVLITLMIGGTAIAGAVSDREFAREGRLRDLETQRAAELMRRQGEREQYLDGLYRRSHRSCRCRQN
jgi:hypothetical protein